MADTRIEIELARAESLIGEGQFDAALPVCQRCAQQARESAEAWFWLGYVQLLRGDLRTAEAEALARAVKLAPTTALYWTNLSIVALGLGRREEAELHARQAVAIDDSSDTVWVNLGSALYHQQRFREAAEAYRQAVARQPQNAAAWSNLAFAELRQENLEPASEALKRSLIIAPSPEPAVMYASLLLRRAQVHEAIHILRQVVAQVPAMTTAWLELGDALSLAGDPIEAEAAYRRGLETDPQSRAGRLSLGLVLLAQFRLGDAEACIRELVTADAQDAEAWALLASIQQAAGRIKEALDSSRRSVALGPDLARHGRLLTVMQYVEDVDPIALLEEHRAWDATYARPLKTSPRLARRDANRPLRIGLASANFGRHPIAFLVLPALERLDKSRCSVVCYSDRLDEDEFTARFRAAADSWQTTVGLDDEKLAKQICDDEIDVLIDLMGHTGRRLLMFARKPAPVQVTWMGYVGTTGLTAMDDLLADRFHVRPGEESCYSESVLRMPESYACYQPPHYMPEVGPLPAATSGRITFGSFSNPAKFSPRLLGAWAEILRRVPSAELRLQFGGLNEPEVHAAFRERLGRLGIESQRIIFEGSVPHPDLLSAYSRVDLALDTQPYSGGVTTCEALWMGVPVITWPGRTFAGRHSTSYLSTAGLLEFIAADMSGYIELAVQWAGRIDELAALRSTLRSRLQQSPLCYAPRFAKNFLAVLTEACATRAGRSA